MKKAVVVAGMAYGDEAKGATVDYLCRSLGASLVVRYNGGHQAAHNVVLEDGRHHTFSQFGSGTFIPGVGSHLSRFMLVNPAAMLAEEEHLLYVGVDDAIDRLSIDEKCVIVTPFHKAFNRLQEMSRGKGAHGSCGVGIGITRQLELAGIALRVVDLRDKRCGKKSLWNVWNYLRIILQDFVYGLEDTPEMLQELEVFQKVPLDDLMDDYIRWFERVHVVESLSPADVMVFEGAQGVLLDEKYGDAPHTTWTNTTFDNALTLLREANYSGEVVRMGCWRSYFTRHGNGPLWGEIKSKWPEKHNGYGRYQGEWRVAPFDYEAAGNAVGICGGVDEIALSHLDYFEPDLWRLERLAGAPVTILGYGPRAKDRRQR